MKLKELRGTGVCSTQIATSETYCTWSFNTWCQGTHTEQMTWNLAVSHSPRRVRVAAVSVRWMKLRWGGRRSTSVPLFAGQSCRVHVDLMTAALCSLAWDVPSPLPSEWTGEACCSATRPPLRIQHCWRWGGVQPHGDRWHLWWATHVCPGKAWQEGHFT